MASDPHSPNEQPPQPWCRGAVAVLFETDAGAAADWARAAALCERCPVLTACRAQLNQAFPGWGPGRRRDNPSSVVWAGAIFSPKRRLLTRQGLARAAADRRHLTSVEVPGDAARSQRPRGRRAGPALVGRAQ